ncbi:MAG: hypothetical protein Rubg2KO_18470 [Rubricoccaceae bacterium]
MPSWLRRALAPDSPLRQNALALADQGTVSATRLLLSILVGRALGADGLGHYALALTLVYLVEGVVETLATLPYTVLRRQSDAASAYTGSVLVLTGAIGLAIGVVVAVCALTLASSLQPVLLVLSVALVARALAEAARRIAFAHERIADALALDLALAVILGGGALALWAAGAITVPWVVGLYGLGSGIPFLAWLALRGRGRIEVRRDRLQPDVARNWSFGRWVLGTRLTLTARMHSIPWGLAAAAGAAEVGLFDAAGKVVGLAVPVLISVANVLTPRVARALHESGVAAVRREILLTTGALVALTSALVVLLTLGADLALGTLFGPEFEGQRLLVMLLGIGLVIESIGIPADAGLWAIERPRVGFWIGLVALVVLAGVGAYLVPTYGAVGAAGALAAASGTAAILQLVAFLKLSAEPDAAVAEPAEDVA